MTRERRGGVGRRLAAVWYAGVLTVCFAALASAEEPPTIIRAPVDVTGIHGATISLVCEANGDPVPTITWTKGGGRKINTSSGTRFDVVLFNGGRGSVLRIDPLRTPRDDTAFECTADNGVGQAASASALLRVLKEDRLPPGFPVITRDPQLKVVEKGRMATLLCSASGNPDPEITWFKDMSPVDMTDPRIRLIDSEQEPDSETLSVSGALQIEDSKEEDQGKYECVATNGEGSRYSSQANLYVRVRRVPPRFSITPEDVEVMPGGNVNVTCVAVGAPMPFVKWRKGAEDLTDEDDMPIGRNVLQLLNVRESANYTCVAMSILGVIEHNAQVMVKALPKPADQPTVKQKTDSSVTLEWTDGENREPMLSYVVQWKIFSSTADYEEARDVTSRRYTVQGLQPYTEYEFRVSAVNNIGQGAPSEPRQATTGERAPSSPPVDVTARPISSSTMLIQWREPEQPNGKIQGYIIYYTTNPKLDITDWAKHRMHSGLLTTISDLITKTTYNIRVQAYTSVGSGPLSPPIQVKTEQGVPSQPTAFRCQGQSESSIQLMWNAAQLEESTVDSYELYYNSSMTNNETHISIRPTEQFELQNLKPNTRYRLRLAARSSRGVGAFTPTIVCSTAQTVPGAPPRDVTGTALDSETIQVRWQPPPADLQNGVLTGYKVAYKEKDGQGGDTILDLPPSEQSCTIPGLKKWTEYEIWVLACTVVGDGPRSDALIVRTDEDVPGPPRRVNAEPINSTYIMVTWRPPRPELANGNVRGYQIHYQRLSPSAEPVGYPMMKDVMNPETEEMAIGALEPDTKYSVQVAAYTLKGDGQRSKPKEVSTLGNVPNKPPVELTRTRDGVQVEWTTPTRTFGAVRGYRVRYGRKGEDLRVMQFSASTDYYVFTGLAKGTLYEFRISAKNGAGFGEENIQQFETPEDRPDGPPENITSKAVDARTIKLAWDAPTLQLRNGRITKYSVRYNDKSNNGPEITNITTMQEIMYRNLRPSTQYVFRVRAHTSVGPGPWSSLVQQGTLYASPTTSSQTVPNTEPQEEMMAKPLNPQAETLSPTSIKVWWQMPGNALDGLIGYRITYSRNPTGDDSTWLSKDVGLVTQAVIGNLEEQTEYSIQVTPLYVRGVGPSSDIMIHRTQQNVPGAPSNVLVKTSDTNRMVLQWDAPIDGADNVQSYKIKYYADKEFLDESGKKKKYVFSNTIVTSVNSKQQEISDLKPHTTYFFEICVIRENGNEGPVITTFEKTLRDVPGVVKPPSFQAKESTETTLPMTLIRSSEENGPVESYVIVVVPVTKGSDGNYVMPRKSPDDYTDEELQGTVQALASSDSVLPARPYIAAKYKAADFPTAFTVGDGSRVNGFYNKPLETGKHYVAFLRAYIPPRPQPTNPGLDRLYKSSQYSDPITAQVSPQVGKQEVTPNNVLWVVAPVMSIIVISVIIIVILMYRRKKTESAPKGGAPEHLTHPTDPVELRRLNYQTPAMMNHPPIPVLELAETTERLKANDNLKFSQEYESIEPGQQFTWDNSNLEVNKPKNRYANVIAYDHSRVILQNIDGVPGSDYLNANYMDGYRRQNAYIATQGPLPETIPDFWRMVWEQRSATVVMMTKLEERTRVSIHVKCDQYWPSRGTETYGSVQVTLLDTIELATYTVRTFALFRHGSSEKREVRQFQFTAWPDHGVPEHPTPFLAFLRRVKACNPPDAGPMIVHCSAGVGRTGCFIVIDAMLERIKHEKTVDVYGHVTLLRAQRNYMVQTEDQYIFIHDAIFEAVSSGNTEVPARNLYAHIQKLTQIEPGETVTGMELEFKRLANTKAHTSRFVSANLPCNKFKNRLVNIMPYESTRVCLQPIRGCDGSDYINASFIDGYRQRNAYIATQGPLAETTEDFWRMLWEHNSTIIVMLTKLREMGREKCHQYWPSERSARYQYFVVDPMAEYNMPQYILREFKVTDARDGQSRTIRQFQFTDWPEQGVPKSGEGFIDFIGQVHKTKEQFGQEGPITAHCSAGVGRTGVFITLAIVLDRMRYEGVVDMFQTVKMLRTQRPAMVQTEDQYQFCYRAALEYLGSFDHYANC
ncbi:receptor-type tyrosine-protein phosphatase delta-like isoform X2 [Branchiostoma lanceolatum]|uniref:receptor-type tyrosine-protein phosphatase delta-like isoform X2 n=1 Tax=Branchiostoma lanceolatum TaxID=7740 RepID=UPI003456FEFC